MDAVIEALIEAVEAVANHDKEAAEKSIAKAKLRLQSVKNLEDRGEWDRDLEERKERG